jgi:hypothetical protein
VQFSLSNIVALLKAAEFYCYKSITIEPKQCNTNFKLMERVESKFVISIQESVHC